MPKPRTAAQIARHERSQKQLRQKHLARKMWASVRIASRLLAWRMRAWARCQHPVHRSLRVRMLDEFVERSAPLCLPRDLKAVRRRPILVGTLLLQQWPSARARRPQPAALPAPPTSSAAAAQPPPALALPAATHEAAASDVAERVFITKRHTTLAEVGHANLARCGAGRNCCQRRALRARVAPAGKDLLSLALTPVAGRKTVSTCKDCASFVPPA